MGLTAQIELALQDASLIRFFDEHRAAFKAIAERSYAFAHDNVEATGLTLRKDDVATSLVVALQTNELLRDCLATKKLRQNHWYTRFSDLVMDRLWEELADEYAHARTD